MTAELGGSGLRATLGQEGLPSLRALFVKAVAKQLNQMPYPIGLPIDAGTREAVTEPAVLADAGGGYRSDFRGGVVRDLPHV
ncbi:hypothetical protein [Lentzea aerocolonigenes]|uniref:hypothetical protein n=1 Tax=Lentzea aerocolonigenes TaxID=68170 RepID=UPI0012E1A847|nr:hypothetical protein [Lentzea aerocolonigenes]